MKKKGTVTFFKGPKFTQKKCEEEVFEQKKKGQRKQGHGREGRTLGRKNEELGCKKQKYPTRLTFPSNNLKPQKRKTNEKGKRVTGRTNIALPKGGHREKKNKKERGKKRGKKKATPAWQGEKRRRKKEKKTRSSVPLANDD